ncbi:hypothetical protein FQU23_016000, partial [Flavobacterium sp. XN-5]|nr:hypothetical protein [Flavobacterium sp. XN-5]
MKSNLLNQNLKQTILFALLLLFISITSGYGQESGTDGNYCPGPGLPGDEYATGVFFNNIVSSSPSSTCQIGTIRAKVDTNNQVLKLGMNIGNGGSALFRLYLDTDNNPLTGLTSDNFGGTLTVAGAEIILEINSNASTFKVYSGAGSTLTPFPLPLPTGLEAHSGGTACNGSGATFLEFNIPFGSINLNICTANNPGVINITKLASVSGNSASSSRCIDTPLTFGIPLKGSVGPSTTVCSGTNSTTLTVSGLTSGSSIIRWEYSVNGGAWQSDLANTTSTYTATNLNLTTKYRAVFSNSGLCGGNGIETSDATITVTPSPVANAGPDQTKCNNPMFTLAAVPTAGNGAWTFVGASGTAIITTPTSANSTVTSVPTDMNITLRWTETNGNCSSTDDLVIRNNAQSIAAAGADQTKCNNPIFTLAAVPTSGTGAWTFIGASGTAVITTPTSATSTVTSVQTDMNITLRWTEINGNCSSTDDVVIRNNALSIAAAGPDQTKCNNPMFTLAAVPTVGNGAWTFVGASGTAVITTPTSATSTVTSVPTDMNITLRWTETNGNCSSTDDIIIRNNAQSIAAAGADQIKCNNPMFTLAAVPTSGTGAWTFIGASGTAVITNPTSATSTVTSVPTDMNITLRWTETNGNCSSTDDVVIRNNAQSIAAAGPDQTKCNNPMFTLAAVPTVGNGAWTFVGASGTAVITTPTSATSTVTSVPTDMNITLRWTETNGNCSSTDDIIIRNNAQSIAAAGPDQTKCNNPMFTLAAVPTSGTGAWTFIGAAGTAVITTPTSATSTVTSVPTDMNITLRWTETNGNCSSTDDIIIRNNAQSIAAAGADQTKCNNSMFTLAAVPTYGTGAWTFIGASGTAVITTPTSATSTVTSVPTDMNITLRWTETNGNCSSTDDVVIRNNAQSIAAAGPDQTKCNNSMFTLAAVPTVGNGAWSFVGASGTAVITAPTSATSTVTSVPTDMNITLRWTETNGNCSSTDDVVVRNNAQSIAAAGPDQTKCNNSMFTLAAVPTVGNGAWTFVGASGTAIITTPTSANSQVTSVPTDMNITLRWTETNGNCSSTDDVVIRNNAQSIAAAGADQTKCNNPIFTLAAVPTLGTGSWTFVGASGTAVITTPTSATSTVTSVPTDMNITLRWTETNGNCSSTDDVVIRNNVQSIAAAGPDQTKCNNPMFTLAAVPTVGNGAWTFVGASGTAVITSPTSATSTVTSIPTDMNITLRWTETNGNCSSTDDIIIRNNAQSIAAAGADQTKCNNSMFTLAAVPTLGTGSWTFVGASGTAVITSPTSATSMVTSVPTDMNITLRWTETNGNCSSIDDVVIRNNALPTIATAASATSVCFSENIQSTPLTYNATSGTPTMYSIVWDAIPSNTFAAVTNVPLLTSPISLVIPAGTAAGTYTGTITVINANDCVSTSKTFSVTINKCDIVLLKESKLNSSGNCTSPEDTITYTFTVTNPGTAPITDIKITDDLLDSSNPLVPIIYTSGDNGNNTLENSETWIYTAIYPISQNDINTGNVTNNATVNGKVLGNDVMGASSTITRLCQNPDIEIIKSNDITIGENGCATLVVGDIVTYTFTVKNSGNVSLNNVNVV